MENVVEYAAYADGMMVAKLGEDVFAPFPDHFARHNSLRFGVVGKKGRHGFFKDILHEIIIVNNRSLVKVVFI